MKSIRVNRDFVISVLEIAMAQYMADAQTNIEQPRIRQCFEEQAGRCADLIEHLDTGGQVVLA